MLTRQQAETMMGLQDAMNARVNPRWVEAAYPYLRAALLEGAEAIEHHGWKWWKKQERDLAQLRMELVDIWHFALSHLLLQRAGNLQEATELLMTALQAPDSLDFDGSTYHIAELDTLGRLELTIGLAAARRFSVPLFSALLADCGMTWNDLYCQYVGKNVLNFFRQDNGYQEGHYRKLWDGREDNQHLVEVMAELDSQSENFRQQLYNSLQSRYQASA